jgi:hypothetical protein
MAAGPDSKSVAECCCLAKEDPAVKPVLDFRPFVITVAIAINGVSVIQESMPPQTAEVPHYHKRSRQFFFVLSGSLSVSIPGGDHVLSAEQGIGIAPLCGATTPMTFCRM